ncbi:MAG: hypothetical protein Q8R83_06740 [Legionellaceae bacterium]|nr:hypothetical protein [Legionellaceae bacterium]
MTEQKHNAWGTGNKHGHELSHKATDKKSGSKISSCGKDKHTAPTKK